MKIWEQFTPEKWTQGKYARDTCGNATDIYSEIAIQWCSHAWILRIYPATHEQDMAREKLISIIKRNITEWNDDMGTTAEEVHNAFKLADI